MDAQLTGARRFDEGYCAKEVLFGLAPSKWEPITMDNHSDREIKAMEVLTAKKKRKVFNHLLNVRTLRGPLMEHRGIRKDH